MVYGVITHYTYIAELLLLHLHHKIVCTKCVLLRKYFTDVRSLSIWQTLWNCCVPFKTKLRNFFSWPRMQTVRRKRKLQLLKVLPFCSSCIFPLRSSLANEKQEEKLGISVHSNISYLVLFNYYLFVLTSKMKALSTGHVHRLHMYSTMVGIITLTFCTIGNKWSNRS